MEEMLRTEHGERRGTSNHAILQNLNMVTKLEALRSLSFRFFMVVSITWAWLIRWLVIGE